MPSASAGLHFHLLLSRKLIRCELGGLRDGRVHFIVDAACERGHMGTMMPATGRVYAFMPAGVQHRTPWQLGLNFKFFLGNSKP